jgi:serine-type D-Ala-D-Ala endopeptidase (penicillin-binding protein 7)
MKIWKGWLKGWLPIVAVITFQPLIATATASQPSPQRASATKSATKSAALRTPQLDLRSSSVMVMDESDSTVLYARKADAVLPVASITKLMTALVVLESHQPMDEMIEVSAEDRDTELGTTSRLRVGTRLTRDDLLHLALMSSENRAAHALARNHPGGLIAFIRAMNLKAEALGMRRTRFADPTGLSSQNVSSASDLTKLVIAASHDPVIRDFSTHKRYAVPVGNQILEFHNTNTLVAKPDWDIAVQKTGYTRLAGRCLVMKATIKGRPVVIVLLNSFGKYTRVADAARIRKWMETLKV